MRRRWRPGSTARSWARIMPRRSAIPPVARDARRCWHRWHALRHPSCGGRGGGARPSGGSRRLPRRRRPWRCGCRSIVNRTRPCPPSRHPRFQAPLRSPPCQRDRRMNGRVTWSIRRRTRWRLERKPLRRAMPLRATSVRLNSRLSDPCSHAAATRRPLPRRPLRRLLPQRPHLPPRLLCPRVALRETLDRRRPQNPSSRRHSRKP